MGASVFGTIASPCPIFDPHQQRVTHAAMTDNKHLSAVPAHIKAKQDKVAATAEVRPESARNAYRNTGRRNTGWNTLEDRKRYAARTASEGCDTSGSDSKLPEHFHTLAGVRSTPIGGAELPSFAPYRNV